MRICNAGFQPAPSVPARCRRYKLLTIIVILLASQHIHAQNYLFSVPNVEMDATLLPSGGASIDYKMEFANSENGHSIDVVDVGMPTEKYLTSEIEASVNGSAVTDIRPSQYVHPGVEVHLADYTIAPGASGIFRFHAVIPDLVFQDTTRKDYASFQITPTWFGDQYVTGVSHVIIRVHLPAGIQAEEVLHQGVAFTGKEVVDGSVVVSWEADYKFSSAYRVGVSFPKRVMTHIVTMSITELIVNWWRGFFSPQARFVIFILAGALLAFIFFRFTGGTGGCLFVIVLIALIVAYNTSPLTEILIWPVLLFLGVVVETVRRRRKAKYLPAIASVEGGGIKRGLTAPEAAILLELPVNKIATLILFGMMKKGLIRQTSTTPLSFSVVRTPPADAVVQPYEKDALTLLDGRPVHKIDFGGVMKNLIDAVAKKMKGFDLEQTTEYYKQIISRAWVEAKTIGDVETWQKTMDDRIDWMILDPSFDDRFAPYSTRYIPRSYRTYPNLGGTFSGGGSTTPPSSSPRFSDVAGSISGWLQNTTQGIVAKIDGQPTGIVNLSGFDKAMGQALASSGSGHSGGGGGCACACAGCACACACAGGGR